MLSSLQDSISGHKGTIEVTIKRHISISFTAGDISVVMPSPSNHPPPSRNVVPLGRAVAIPLGCGGSQAPHRVEIVPLFLEAFFTSSEVLRHSSGTSQLLALLEDFFTPFSKSFAILLGLLCFFLYLQVQLLLLAVQVFLRISADISKNACCGGLASIW